MNAQVLDIFALALLLILGIAVPLLGVWDFRRLTRWVEEGRADAKMKTYNWILMMEWGLTLGLLAWYFAAGKNLGDLKIVSLYQGWQWVAVGAGLGAVVFLIWQMMSVRGNSKELAKISKKMGDLAALVPRTGPEQRVFTLVSFTAGICEEIIYRGLLMITLAPVLGVWQAVALSSVIFGLGHVYQGFEGVVKTTLLGSVMALLALFSGSLLIPIIVHAVVDLTSGRLMGAAAEADLSGTEIEPGLT
jgi:membrane protease YdiL (CAAX protease family)